MKRKQIKKSIFIHSTIRPLTSHEQNYIKGIKELLELETVIAPVSEMPTYISKDTISRPLVLTKEVMIKIEKKHGKINPENLIICAHDWDIIIKNMDNTPEKICIIKHIPYSNNILLIGAFRKNGFFILTHYEVEILQDNQLKSLLGRGDVIRKDA